MTERIQAQISRTHETPWSIPVSSVVSHNLRCTSSWEPAAAISGTNSDPTAFGFSADSYREITSITLTGKLREPQIAGFDTMELQLMQFDLAIEPGAGIYMPSKEPRGSGSLAKHTGVIGATVSLPRHSLGTLKHVLATGNTAYALLIAQRFRYGRAVTPLLERSTVYPE